MSFKIFYKDETYKRRIISNYKVGGRCLAYIDYNEIHYIPLDLIKEFVIEEIEE